MRGRGVVHIILNLHTVVSVHTSRMHISALQAGSLSIMCMFKISKYFCTCMQCGVLMKPDMLD